MTDDFKELKMYQCAYCQRVFYTAKRHHCKFKPEYRNCFSCMNCSGVIEKIQEPVVDKEYFPVCEHAADGEVKTYTYKYTKCECGDGQNIAKLAKNKWKLDCPHWREIPEYIGKKTYVRRAIWHLS